MEIPRDGTAVTLTVIDPFPLLLFPPPLCQRNPILVSSVELFNSIGNEMKRMRRTFGKKSKMQPDHGFPPARTIRFIDIPRSLPAYSQRNLLCSFSPGTCVLVKTITKWRPVSANLSLRCLPPHCLP